MLLKLIHCEKIGLKTLFKVLKVNIRTQTDYMPCKFKEEKTQHSKRCKQKKQQVLKTHQKMFSDRCNHL